MKLSKPFFTFILFVLTTISVQGQGFSVSAFRVLTNDITAYITPVRDLNNEACALVKVVGSHDFAFSTPLGIVERRNEIGEIWLYLPKGSIQITIKHPKWGVLRDYSFGQALESRMTYELVLAEPIEYKHPATMPLKKIHGHILMNDNTIHPVKEWEFVPFKRPKEPVHYLLLGNVGFSSESWSAGVRLGMMRRHGGYLLYQSNFNASPQTIGTCNRNGEITESSASPYYTGKTTKSEYMIIAGGMHKLWQSLSLYEGLGYGKRMVAWESINDTYYKNADYSVKGIAAEMGLMWRFNKLVVSAGAMTISGKHWEGTVGMGIHF